MIVSKVDPLCPVFGKCGGCLYQDIPYTEELRIKEAYLKELLHPILGSSESAYEPIVASPKEYHYRHQLDLRIERFKNQEIDMGFSSPQRRGRLIPVEKCFIAAQEIFNFLPQLKREASACFSSKYRQGNLVVRSGQDNVVRWGGLGQGSLSLEPKDYFWVEILGKKIHYSLDTFFQANLSILSRLIERIRGFDFWGENVVLYDLYGGVGFFGISLYDKAGKVVLIEGSKSSTQLAEFNVSQLRLTRFEVIRGLVEEKLSGELLQENSGTKVAVIDPPRAGLSSRAKDLLMKENVLKHILYLSCNPEALCEDLGDFVRNGWKIEKVIPYDFFPKTKHLETLVALKSR